MLDQVGNQNVGFLNMIATNEVGVGSCKGIIQLSHTAVYKGNLYILEPGYFSAEIQGVQCTCNDTLLYLNVCDTECMFLYR